MNKQTIRLLLKWSLLINAAFLILVLVDYLALDSAAMFILLPLYGLLVALLVVLLVIDEKPHYRRLAFQDRPEAPKTVIYGRR